MFYYLWEKMHNIHTNICMKMDDVPYKIKRMPFCFEWKTLCWTILRLHDTLRYLVQSWCFIIMIIVVLMLRFAWVYYLEKNMNSIRIRISNLNKEFVNLHIKVLKLKTTQSILGTLGVTNSLTDIDSENDDPKISEHDSATSQSLPMHGFITQYLKSDDKERHAFLEVWSNFVAQEKKKMENKPVLKRVASEITLPTHLYMRVPTTNLMLSTHFDPTEFTQTKFEPEQQQAELNYITPSVCLRSPCRSKSMIQKDSKTMHSTGLRNHRMDQAKRLGLDPKENMYEQSYFNGGRSFSEMHRQNIYNFQNRDYVQSNFYVPPLFPYQLHEMKKGTNVNVGKNNKNNVSGVNRKEKCKPIKNNNNNNNRNNNNSNNTNRNDINSRNNSTMNNSTMSRGRPNRFHPVNQTYTVRWNY